MNLWFIYLTDQGFLALTIHWTVSTAVVIEHLLQERDGIIIIPFFYGIVQNYTHLLQLLKLSRIF